MKKKEVTQLDLDAHEAIQRGISYGKYMAMKAETQAKLPKALPEGWKVCPCCGDAFKPKTRRPTIYCGAMCQREAARQRELRKKEAGL